MNFLKNLILTSVYFIAVFIILFIINLCDRLPEFRIYHSERDGFSILMPGEPETSSQELKTPFFTYSSTTISAGSRKSQFMVSTTKLAGKITRIKYGFDASTNPALDFIKSVILATGGGEIIKETDLDFCGLSAKEYEMEIIGIRSLRARVIPFNNKYYVLMVRSKSEKVLDEKAPEFFDSLKFDSEQ